MRHELMFRFGVEPHLITRCLRETKRRLIAAGAKADNLPRKPEQEVQFIAGLNAKAMEVVREWFRENAKFEGVPEVGVAIALLRASDTSNEVGETSVGNWRAILQAFAEGNSAPGAVGFLAGEELPSNIDSGRGPDPKEALDVSLGDAALCLQVVQGKPPGDTDGPLPNFVAGLLAVARGDATEAAKWKGNLEANATPVCLQLAGVIGGFERSRGLEHAPGLNIRKSMPLSHGTQSEIEGCPVFGVVKSVLPTGQVFARIAGVYVGTDLIELTPHQARDLFPLSGEVTAFRGTLPGHPDEAEMGLWNVEHRSPEKNTQFVITEQVAKVYEVIQIPHASTEPDRVRGWLQSTYRQRPSASPIFQLLDGLVLRLPGEASEYNYDVPIDGYLNVDAIQLTSGRRIVLKQLPAPEVRYDCAPPTTWIKRLLRSRAESMGFPSFSRAQLQALVEFADSEDPAPGSYARAEARLLEIQEQKELLTHVVTDLLELPEVKAGIEAAKTEIVERFRQEGAMAQSEIDRLEKQKQELHRDIERQRKALGEEVDRQKKSVKQHEAELERRIKITFERATADGMATLAETSLLRGVLGVPRMLAAQGVVAAPEDPRPSQRRGTLPDPIPGVSARCLEATDEIRRAIHNRAAAGGLSESMLVTVIAGARASAVVGLLGERARLIASAVSDVISAGVKCEVSVTGDMFGVADLLRAPAVIRAADQAWTACLGDFLESQEARGAVSVVEICGFNRVPPESFLPELFAKGTGDEATGGVSWTDQSGQLRFAALSGSAIFVLTFVVGKSTFPLQPPLANNVPVLHVDMAWQDEGPAEPAFAQPAAHVSASAWRALVSPSEASGSRDVGQPGSSASSRLMQAALMLGAEHADAEALAHLALQAGRQDPTELERHITSTASTFLPYVKEALDGQASRLMNHIFQN